LKHTLSTSALALVLLAIENHQIIFYTRISILMKGHGTCKFICIEKLFVLPSIGRKTISWNPVNDTFSFGIEIRRPLRYIFFVVGLMKISAVNVMIIILKNAPSMKYFCE
jgi:hypothetical protein